MTDRLNPRSRKDPYGSRINREHSPVLAYALPWGSILIASVLPIFVMTSALPLVPPLGFLFLVAWRLVRPGLLPIWAGLPLGLFSDLYSGQPFGSGALLWSLAMMAMEGIEARFPWRGFLQDWATATGMVVVYLLAAALLSGATPSLFTLGLVLLQLVVSILAYPLVARVVAFLDRVRLTRWKEIG